MFSKRELRDKFLFEYDIEIKKVPHLNSLAGTQNSINFMATVEKLQEFQLDGPK